MKVTLSSSYRKTCSFFCLFYKEIKTIIKCYTSKMLNNLKKNNFELKNVVQKYNFFVIFLEIS